MISLQAYWKGRDRQFSGELTDEIRDNAEEMLAKANALLERADMDFINGVNSGWRPKSVNDATANSGSHSKHITAEAVDIPDPERKLARWCCDNQDALQDIGLWMEDPRWTPTWVHVQIVPPGSGKRIYIPSSAPASDPGFRIGAS